MIRKYFMAYIETLFGGEIMILSTLLVIGILALMFKVTGWMFGLFGKLLGILFGGIGYILIGILAVGILGIAFFIIPVIFIAGIVSIGRAIVHI